MIHEYNNQLVIGRFSIFKMHFVVPIQPILKYYIMDVMIRVCDKMLKMITIYSQLISLYPLYPPYEVRTGDAMV